MDVDSLKQSDFYKYNAVLVSKRWGVGKGSGEQNQVGAIQFCSVVVVELKSVILLFFSHSCLSHVYLNRTVLIGGNFVYI